MKDTKKTIVLFLIVALTAGFSLFPVKPAAAVTITDLETQIEGTNVFVTWRTDQASSGCVQFGKSIEYEMQLCSIVGLNTYHDLLLTNLLPETYYHYRVVSRDAGNNEVKTTDGTFKTGKRADTTKPEIENLNIEFVGATVAMITWKTNEEAVGVIEYGSGSGSLNKAAGSKGDKINHEVVITRLEPGAMYFYQVKVTDEDKNVAYSSIQSFRMALNKRIEEEPLNINLIKPITPTDDSITETSAVISWRNSRPASGSVAYGTNPESLNKSVKVDDSRVFQTVELTGLAPGTRYYYRIRETDILRQKADAPSTEGTFSFVTKSRAVVLGVQTVLGSENNSFSRTGQAAVLTSLTKQGPKVLGAFTSIYTPAVSLVKTLHSPDIYAILKNQKHWIRSGELFTTYGYNFGDVKIISIPEIDQIPYLRLVKTPDNSTVYYIYPEQKVRINIPSPTVFESYENNRWGDIVTIAKEDMNLYPVATLVKTDNNSTVYLLENNSRRPLASEEVMSRFGFNNNQVVLINNTHLNSIPLGDTIK